MGGSGGGGFIPPRRDAIQRKLEESRRIEKERLDSNVNEFLQNLLVEFNDRDTDATKEKLDSIFECIDQEYETETLLYGGSVAKHTYVDGLSDIDALAIIKQQAVKGESPQSILKKLHKTLNDTLPKNDVQSVEIGTLAITIKYQDETEVQILPAIRSNEVISIPNDSGSGWNKTDPKEFQRKITQQNERLNYSLVPTIKLLKSLVSDLQKEKQLTGYHIEAITLDAARNYDGPKTPKSFLLNVIQHASERVHHPIQDVTGQSQNVDEYLGEPNSGKRALVSRALSAIQRRLEAATSVEQWKAMFGRSNK